MSAVDVNQPATSLGRVRVGSTTPVRDTVWQRIWRDRIMLLFIAPGVVYFLLFHYLPLLGYIIAFEDYLPFLGFFDSQFVGFANFGSMFSDTAFWQAFSNTIMTEPGLFKALATSQVIWKETGWGTIIYLAALLNIEASLYEAAVVDGAGRWQRLWNITLPGILGVTMLLLILRLGLALSVGFEQILLQRNAVGPAAGEVLDTYVYFKGIVGGQWGITAAAGLIKGIFGTILVISANKLAHRMGQEGVYS